MKTNGFSKKYLLCLTLQMRNDLKRASRERKKPMADIIRDAIEEELSR